MYLSGGLMKFKSGVHGENKSYIAKYRVIRPDILTEFSITCLSMSTCALHYNGCKFVILDLAVQ
jgi:hypothetical protein